MDIAPLAALAGNALVVAAVTDPGEELRRKIARLFGRGQAEPPVEPWVEETRQQLAATTPAELERAQAILADQWQTRFANLLSDYPDATGELDGLVREINATAPAAVDHSVAAARDISAKADHGGVAAIIVHGNVTAGPTKPGPASS